MIEKGWKLFDAGKMNEAIREFQKGVRKDPSLVNISALGSCYLRLSDYQNAQTTFEGMAKVHPDVSTGYEWSGVCLWLQACTTEAVIRWREGLSCGYTDSAGGMQIPLFLYFSGIRKPTVMDPAEAQALIQRKLSTKWAGNWPAPIGRFLLGDIDESELTKLALECEELDEPSTEQSVQMAFYKGIRALAQGKKKVFNRQMKECTEIPDAEDEYEYYLAWFELIADQPLRKR